MAEYSFFIDESGTASPKSYITSPYFCLCGVLIPKKHGEKLKDDFAALKVKYFGKSTFVFHATELRYNLRIRCKSLDKFSDDLSLILTKNYFLLLYVVVDKEKAVNLGWDLSATVYKRSYRILLSNFLKFLEAKRLKGKIFAEASNFGQDQYLYKAFAELIGSGISEAGITHRMAKTRLPSICFVTKFNNGAEEQLCDLFGTFGRIEAELLKGLREESSFDSFEKVILNFGRKRLFLGHNAAKKRKQFLYEQIDSLKFLP